MANLILDHRWPDFDTTVRSDVVDVRRDLESFRRTSGSGRSFTTLPYHFIYDGVRTIAARYRVFGLRPSQVDNDSECSIADA